MQQLCASLRSSAAQVQMQLRCRLSGGDFGLPAERYWARLGPIGDAFDVATGGYRPSSIISPRMSFACISALMLPSSARFVLP
jgi:hypothetical protein